MAIPVHLQQFKAAGIYRVVFDKSTISGVNSEILRLVVGYSEQGPFNIPTYITSPSDFKAIYGDISKKLEKRGIYFHRLAIHALSKGPILALNLKKFDGETVDGASINTDFNPVFDPIDTVEINVEDIYDTTRFWELSAEKLNELKTANGQVMDQYINICTTNTKKTSATYFIRKAAASKLNGYKVTVSDWYADGFEEMPDYLERYKNSLISDFMAEIYVFKGRFTGSQVLASNTLKHYFEILRDENGDVVLDDEDNEILKLRDHMTNAFGDYVDTLDALYNDETSGALGHYVGSLIPYFKNKRGGYEALDILFNSDQDVHNMMMSFNTDMLDEDGTAHIDISGRLSIPTSNDKQLSMSNLFNGSATTTLLGNKNAKVITSKIDYSVNILKTDETGKLVTIVPFNSNNLRKATGTLFVKSIDEVTGKITLAQVGESTSTVVIDCGEDKNDLYVAALELGAAYKVSKAVAAADNSVIEITLPNKTKANIKLHNDGYGTYWSLNDPAYLSDEGEFMLQGPSKVITAIVRIDKTSSNDTNYTDLDKNMKVTFEDVICVENVTEEKSINGNSIAFLPISENWEMGIVEGSQALICKEVYDKTLLNSLQTGDYLLAADGTADLDEDGEADIEDGFYDNVLVQEVGTIADDLGNVQSYYIKLSGTPLQYVDNADASGNIYLVRIDASINQEIGTIVPQYLEGYVYKNSKPEGTSMYDKLQWQKFILSTLSSYKGLRTGLLNKANIDYRYIVDTFESYVDENLKSELTYLAKEKQSALAILNFPSVKTFMKCPYTSFVDNNGVFKVEYVVAGYNKKKPAGIRFSLPSEADGASFGAFYSPLKFSDGYIDTNIPSAGLVSNLFMEKYMSRQPYYIIAGPNYGAISASGLVGPDYKYSAEELHIIEPFGINCMVYRPGFGTFINANQTAKQTPVSALSKVHVRELVIYLQDEIEKVLQSYQWEFNNARTRQAILDKANAICSRIAGNGGIQAYMNIMDESNNGPEIIDNEMAVLSTHIEPGMGCGKMVHELTLYRTGQMASAISE